MKKLNITKEQFNRSNYFQKKYGKLKYVSESGKLFKTNKGKVLKFVNESHQKSEHLYSVIVKKPGGWDGSFQVNAMSSDEALEKARAKIGRGSKILRIEDIGEYKAFDADDYAGFNESEKKLVKEGAGAGYDVGISDLEIDKVTEVKELEDGDYAFTATIKPGFYEISASDYYNDFFWQEHEWGDKPEAKIDGGVIHGTICPWEDTDDPEEWVSYHVKGHTFNLSFMYGGGWMHVNLPEDGQLYIDKHIEITPDLYFSIDDIQLDAVDLVQAVNCGYASLDDRYNDEEDEDEGEGEGEGEGEDEPMNESSDKDWSLVGDYYVEFVQRLWEYTRKDIKNRKDAFSRCTNAMEKALREYYNEVVYDGAD